MRYARFVLLGLVAVEMLLVSSPPAVASPGTTERVSVASDGTESNGPSGGSWGRGPSISGDGRFIAFQSLASNLIPNDTNGWDDIFVHDRQTGETSRVSVASDGAEADGWETAISGDGRFVAFLSGLPLVPGDTNDWGDVFVHDRQTGETSRVSVASDGSQAWACNYPSMMPPAPPCLHDISADGRYVSFRSNSPHLVAGGTNGASHIFVHDRQTSETVLVSLASDGTEANGWSYESSISADGRYVAFSSGASNLDPAGFGGVFVHDRQTGETVRASVASDGAHGNGAQPAISADGRYVAFSGD